MPYTLKWKYKNQTRPVTQTGNFFLNAYATKTEVEQVKKFIMALPAYKDGQKKYPGMRLIVVKVK